ncbi:MAG TPA: pirin family protein, partial [Isosphaeraceae bacterium]|nr:pirin family protein [Isosphaeraceae bacterium]
RGHFDHGWLNTFHSFSFSAYHDPQHMGFRSLRVINEDWIHPGRGFGMHGHENMEIVTYVLEGALAHRDSLGTERTIETGEVQHMTAGSGILHSEFNPSPTEPVHLYQIWLRPERNGLNPSYDQKTFPKSGRQNRFQPVATPDGEAGSLVIRQDARLLLGSLEAGHSMSHPLQPGRHAWVQVLSGSVDLLGQTLQAGDGAALSEEEVALQASEPSEVLLFDLA